MLIEQHPYHLN
jgi:hypothetical protein